MKKTQNFYTSRDLEKHPDAYIPECKKCFTMHINLDEPSSFLGLLEEMDVPYIPSVWKEIVDRYRGNTKTTPTAIFGRYVGRTKLSQYSKFKYEDSQKFIDEEERLRLQKEAVKLAELNKYRDAIDSGEAVDALKDLNLNLSDLDTEDLKSLLIDPDEKFEYDPEADINSLITKEDKVYLVKKWGRNYTVEEMIKLEKLYHEMMESYDIRTASHIDYLLKICRVSLKIDQALEVNDIDGFQKLSKIYDVLMKSAKFTAAQNKDMSENNMDAVGVIVALCEEQNGFIPKYHSERQDVVDITLQDMNNFTKELITSELNLGNMIEVHLQKMMQEQEQEEGELDEEDELLILSNDVLATEEEEASIINRLHTADDENNEELDDLIEDLLYDEDDDYDE